MNPNYSEKLSEFTSKLRNIPEILAAYYTGSTAKESWDEYSDIDVDIIVKDGDYNKIVKRLPKLLSMWGKINLCNHYRDCDETYAYIGKDYTKVEISPIKKSSLKPSWKLRDIRIAFDKEGTLTKAVRESKNEKKPKLDHKEFVHLFLYLRDSFIYSAKHYARGQKLSGASELGIISAELFYYLGKIKGMEGYENIRTAEKHLTKKEWGFVKVSGCRSLEKREVKRALKANWDYMKYLEKLYEKKTGRKLGLKCDDREILKLIDRILK